MFSYQEISNSRKQKNNNNKKTTICENDYCIVTNI